MKSGFIKTVSRRRLQQSGLLILSVLLVSCDSSDSVPVIAIDDVRLDERALAERNKALVEHKQQALQGKVFNFGFEQRLAGQYEIKQYLPFLKYLESKTGYRFKLNIINRKKDIVDELGENRVQFAAMGGVAFVKANVIYGAVSVARGLNKYGTAEYRSCFVVSPQSPIKRMLDISGRRVAFGNRNSTQGHLIPRIMMLENNIDLEDLASYEYTGSHQRCAEAVVAGRDDVCGLQDQLAKRLVAKGVVRLLHCSDNYPSSGIVASHSVSEEVRNKVQQALLDFKPLSKDADKLYEWNRTEMAGGFIASDNHDYDVLRDWLFKLGILAEMVEDELP